MKKTRVLLINPPGIEQAAFNNPPLALLYLAGTLKKQKIKVKVLDGFFCGWWGIEKEIKKFKPTIVGVTCLSLYRHKSNKVAKIAKKINQKILVVFGGVHATIMHIQLIKNYPFIDIVVRGEGERTFLKIAQGKPLGRIKGITYRRNGEVIVNQPQKYVKNLDKIPFPAWEMVNLSKYPPLSIGITEYNGIDLRKVPRIPVIFSRGCPGHCIFCSNWLIWRGWRGRSGKNMADEIELLYRKHGIKHFCFADDCMTVDAKKTIAFCDEIIRRKLKIAFNISTRTDVVNLKMLRRLKQAGCYCIGYGVESASPKILKLLDKSNSIKNSEEAIRLTKKAGIKVLTFMITGGVGETFQTINQSIKFLQKTKPDFVSTVGGLWVLPGTKLYSDLKAKGEIDDNYWLEPKPIKVFRGSFSDLQLRYFRMNMEKMSLVSAKKKNWRSLPFLLFYYSDRLAKQSLTTKNLLIRFYVPAYNLIKKLIS